jgi:hypothetical protein
VPVLEGRSAEPFFFLHHSAFSLAGSGAPFKIKIDVLSRKASAFLGRGYQARQDSILPKCNLGQLQLALKRLGPAEWLGKAGSFP